MRGDILDALKTYAQHPGISFVADRLAKATVGDLKAFEEEIRGTFNANPGAKEKDKPAAPGAWECPLCKKHNKAADATCKATAECKGKKP